MTVKCVILACPVVLSLRFTSWEVSLEELWASQTQHVLNQSHLLCPQPACPDFPLAVNNNPILPATMFGAPLLPRLSLIFHIPLVVSAHVYPYKLSVLPKVFGVYMCIEGYLEGNSPKYLKSFISGWWDFILFQFWFLVTGIDCLYTWTQPTILTSQSSLSCTSSDGTPSCFLNTFLSLLFYSMPGLFVLCISRCHFPGLPSRPLSLMEPFFQLNVLSLFMSSLVPMSLPVFCLLAFLHGFLSSCLS